MAFSKCERMRSVALDFVQWIAVLESQAFCGLSRSAERDLRTVRNGARLLGNASRALVNAKIRLRLKFPPTGLSRYINPSPRSNGTSRWCRTVDGHRGAENNVFDSTSRCLACRMKSMCVSGYLTPWADPSWQPSRDLLTCVENQHCQGKASRLPVSMGKAYIVSSPIRPPTGVTSLLSPRRAKLDFEVFSRGVSGAHRFARPQNATISLLLVTHLVTS
ncbi:hypothetical protein RRG08_000469 [Elysia crispata]|uniref:Uncharacterized protein n=1 Tax=Elysia crispata TaxID=231223 RepID=A0AAE1CWU6_9GAST|nr:hypothetical protein RRG08_000469 [Elysia crispata]